MTRSPVLGWREGGDRLLDHRTRLAICVLLARNDSLSFARLKQLLGETDGSLGAQLRKLEDSGYLRAKKEFRERKPVTWYSLQAAGRKALLAHLEGLAALLDEIHPRGRGRSG